MDKSDGVVFDYKLGIMALTINCPPIEETKDIRPIGLMIVSTNPLASQSVFRHKGDWVLWEQACKAHREKMLTEAGEERAKQFLEHEARVRERWAEKRAEFDALGAKPYHNSYIDPKHYPIVITLGWRAEITEYGYCREDGSTDYHSPVLSTKEEAIDWIVENIGLYGGRVYKVYYEPQKGLDRIQLDGWVDEYVSSGVWLVMSHPEFDKHTRPLPEHFYNHRTPEEKEKIRKELIEKYKGIE